MSNLPSYIIDPVTQKELRRKGFLESGLYRRESDLDKVVVDHRKLIADLLVENEVLEDGSDLKLIGQQFENVDVLFAETDDEGEPSRLVLVENKLLKNPEARRGVIG